MGWRPDGSRLAKAASDSVLTTGNMTMKVNDMKKLSEDKRAGRAMNGAKEKAANENENDGGVKESKQEKWNYDWIAGTEGWGADRSPLRVKTSGNEHDHCANTTTTTILTTTTTTTPSSSQVPSGPAMLHSKRAARFKEAAQPLNLREQPGHAVGMTNPWLEQKAQPAVKP